MARRVFGATWWGAAWIDALEHRARLDPNRLPRGRTYARQDRVGELQLGSGEIIAPVQGSRRSPYVVRVRLRTFTSGEWDGLLGAVAARAGHAAALLDGELEPGIVEDARGAGVELLPDAGELQPRCSCPDWADPCKHAAAVCYLVADVLDADPFALFELRGRGRGEVLADLRARRRTASGEAPSEATVAPADPGVPAANAWRRPTGDLPAVPPPPGLPGQPAAWPVDPPVGAAFTAAGLLALARDAAGRARALAAGESSSALHLDRDADLARRAAAALGTDRWADLVRASGRRPTDLARTAIAWRHAGEAGLRALDEPRWRPRTAVMAQARQALLDGGVAARALTVDGNALIIASERTQYRLGRDGRWYRFTKRGGRWEVSAPPADDPEDLLAD